MIKTSSLCWCFRVLLVSFSFVASTIWAATPLSSASARHYLVDVSGDGREDFVYLDKTANALVVCDDGDVTRCKSFSTNAVDFVPLMREFSSRTELLLIDSAGYPQVCLTVADVAQLSCQSGSLANIAQYARGAARENGVGTLFSFPHLGNSVNCGSRNGYSLACSRVRKVQQQNEFLVGRFTSPIKDQIISFRGAKAQICDTGTVPLQCRGLKGLEATEVDTAYDAIKMLPDGRSAIFSISATNFNVCVTGISSGADEVQFTCAQGTFDTDHATAVAYIVPSLSALAREKIQFFPDGRQQKTDGAKRAASSELAPNAQAVPMPLDDALARDEGAISALASELQMRINSLQGTSSYQQRDGILKVLGYDDDGNPEERFPERVSFSDDTDNWSYDFWSDTWGYYYEWATVPPSKCQADCQSGLDNDLGFCALASGTVAAGGIGATIGATIGTAFTGPGALAVAATGVALTADVTGVVAAICVGNAYTRNNRCKTRC